MKLKTKIIIAVLIIVVITALILYPDKKQKREEKLSPGFYMEDCHKDTQGNYKCDYTPSIGNGTVGARSIDELTEADFDRLDRVCWCFSSCDGCNKYSCGGYKCGKEIIRLV